MSGKKITPSDFATAEDGAMSVFGLFLFLAMLVVGGLAVDVANLIQQRAHLQVAADVAAHAALYTRDTRSEEEAKAAALEIAATNMPASRHGIVLVEDDIEFGFYDTETDVFTPQAGSRYAVRVSTKRLEENQNGVSTYLLRLAGLDFWNITRDAVFMTYRPPCFREGFVAQERVDLQSNNSYRDGFCIHSNDHVSLNSNNLFEPGTVVSMPDLADLDLPKSGFKTNEGLEAALRYGKYHIRILSQLPQVIQELRDPLSDRQPEYITRAGVVNLSGNKVPSTSLVQGAVHILTCNNNGKSTIEGPLVTRVVIVSNCELSFSQGVVIEDAIIATTHTGRKSMNAPSSLQVGRNDNCAPGGGAQLLTLGSMDFASDLKMYNGQLIAAGDIYFSANANGIKGASMVAGGEISGTSNMEMGFCETGMEDNVHANYFRMVQ